MYDWFSLAAQAHFFSFFFFLLDLASGTGASFFGCSPSSLMKSTHISDPRNVLLVRNTKDRAAHRLRFPAKSV